MRDVNQAVSTVVFPVWGQAACICLLVIAQSALANPAGGKVTQGNATISNSGTTTTIQQTSNKAVINWNSFSINPNETTQFLQPSSKSFTLNRVIGGNPSQILGHLSANGTVYIINQNGILFGKNAVINVGGLVASTANISDKQFMKNGAQVFTQSPSGASIINEGLITVKDSGIAVLVSPTVINDGIISANLGTVALASGDRFTLDLYGDNLIAFDAGQAMTNEILGNSGIIQANGGKVMLTAQAADAMVSNTINMDGIIEAKSVSTKNGKVILQGADNSTVNVSGKIDVSGKKSGETGGLVQVTGKTVNLKNNSKIDASGDAGGGMVNVGGEYQGKGQLAHADFVNMDSGASITASALQKGNGGIVTLWADENTNANGSIFAQGGIASGNGGLIETSSHNTLNTLGAEINAGAFAGAAGTWLLDPVTLNVTDGLAVGYNSSLNAITPTNVNIATSDVIRFNNFTTPIAWSTTASFSAYSNSSGFDLVARPNTITFTGCGVGQCQINSSGGGLINFYYNPVAFITPTSFAANVTGPLTAYMEINNTSDLQNINFNLSGNYALNNNLVLTAVPPTSSNFTALGPFSGIFTGNIQGTQFTISNLSIFQPAISNIGLFTSVSGTLDSIHLNQANIVGLDNVGAIAGTTSGNLTGSFSVTNSTITGSGNYLGGLIGYVNGGNVYTTMSTDSNTTVTGVAAFTNYMGGLVGNVSAASWYSDATNSATVTGSATSTEVGGLYGRMASVGGNGGTITNNGSVFGQFRVGGIAGNMTGWTTSIATNYGNVTGSTEVGGYAGFTPVGTMLYTFVNYGTITGNGLLTAQYIGGAIGQTVSTSTQAMTNYGAVNASTSDYVGGLIGQAGSSTIIGGDLTNYGGVTGQDNVGGVIGLFDFTGDPTSSSMINHASVVGVSNTGGIFGRNDSISNVPLINYGNVTGNINTGGIAGFNTGVINGSKILNVTINGSGGNSVGGIAGNNLGTITNSSVKGGTITSGSSVGGIAGESSGTVNNVSFDGSVSGSSSVGGIVGYNNGGTVQYALNLGSVSGTSVVGAIAGNNQGPVLNSFYDTSKTGSLPPVDPFTVLTGPTVIGSTAYATTNPLSSLTTFTNNGFSTFAWQHIGGYYPSLIYCGTSCATLLPVIPSSNVVVTQLVNNTITNLPEVPMSTNGLLVTPAEGAVDNTGTDAQVVGEFLDETYVLQGLDGLSTEESSDPNYVKNSISDTVKALQKARGCAAK